jgi:hypothetical protein
MIIKSVFTESEGDNILYVLKKTYGNLKPKTLIKYAIREFVEIKRLERNKGVNK